MRVTADYLYQSHKARAYPQESWGIHGLVTPFTDASVNDARRLHDRCKKQIYRGQPHDFGDCCTTSVNAIRHVFDGSTTDLRLNSHRAVVDEIEHV